jgi:hypothetical protein
MHCHRCNGYSTSHFWHQELFEFHRLNLKMILSHCLKDYASFWHNFWHQPNFMNQLDPDSDKKIGVALANIFLPTQHVQAVLFNACQNWWQIFLSPNCIFQGVMLLVWREIVMRLTQNFLTKSCDILRDLLMTKHSLEQLSLNWVSWRYDFGARLVPG